MVQSDLSCKLLGRMNKMPDLWSRIQKLIDKGKENAIDEDAENLIRQSLPSGVRVVVRRPHSFAESESIAALVKNGQAVVVNLEDVPIEVAQRLVDYLCGATYALNGNMEKVGTSIFFFAPAGVDIHVRDFFGLNDESF